MFCNKCGAQLEDNAVFCSNCGASVTAMPDDEAVQPKKNTAALISMILGIVSIPMGSFAAAIAAIILAGVSKKKGKSTFATVGLITGIIGIVFSVIMLVVLLPQMMEMLELVE